MKILLDTSVLLSAVGSNTSLSRLIFVIAAARQWQLTTAAYCQAEVDRNLLKMGLQPLKMWPTLRDELRIVPNAYSGHRPLLLATSKDKPVLLSALAEKCHVLLTLDKGDFGVIFNSEVYGLLVLTPRDFLVREGLGPT